MLTKEQIIRIEEIARNLAEVQSDKDNNLAKVKLLEDLKHKNVSLMFSVDGERVEVDIDVSPTTIHELIRAVVEDEMMEMEHFDSAINGFEKELNEILTGGFAKLS